MSCFKEFVEITYEQFKNVESIDEIHIVLGNESCDLDSTMSSLAYGYFLFRKLNLKESTVAAVVLPVLNVDHKEFPLRSEHCSLLKKCKIDLDKLIYRSCIDFEDFLKLKRVKTYLVDHHVLAKNDEMLKNSVVKIFDHRPIDEKVSWPINVNTRIESVGSCATIIVDEVTKSGHSFCRELAYLLYCTIVFDTLALLPENKKATSLDIEMAAKLEDKFNFKEDDRVILFEYIVDLHNDFSNFNCDQLLIRDLKIVDNIPVAALPMLVMSFTKQKDFEQSLKSLCDKYKAPFLVLIGVDLKHYVKKELGLFFIEKVGCLKTTLMTKLKREKDLQLEEIPSGVENLVVLKQFNIEKSRKHIIPIIQSFIEDIKERP